MTCILVTGSSRGIGAATVKALAQRGVTVIGHATRAGDAEQIAADFSNPFAAQILWEEAMDRSGGQIAALVNNAGIYQSNPIDSSDIEWLDAWEETMRINLTAAAQLSRFAVRHWMSQDAPANAVRGRLVHVASRAAHRGDMPDHWHYAAAKAGMLAMHKSIARGVGADGILSFGIAPGLTETEMAAPHLQGEAGAAVVADIPIGRVATPEEVARLITFCALDAPPSMSGTTLDINGASYVR